MLLTCICWCHKGFYESVLASLKILAHPCEKLISGIISNADGNPIVGGGRFRRDLSCRSRRTFWAHSTAAPRPTAQARGWLPHRRRRSWTARLRTRTTTRTPRRSSAPRLTGPRHRCAMGCLMTAGGHSPLWNSPRFLRCGLVVLRSAGRDVVL